MKIHGRQITTNTRLLVLPRQDQDIVLKFQAIVSMDEFEEKCPAPKAPVVTGRKGETYPDFTDPHYKASLETYGNMRTDYMVLKSLSVTDGLEWETVDMDKPSTWNKWEKELMDSGFSTFEVQRIIGEMLEVNSLSDSSLEEARKRFLAGLEATQE